MGIKGIVTPIIRRCGEVLTQLFGALVQGEPNFEAVRPFRESERMTESIRVVYTDNNTAYQSRVTNSKVVTGKKNTQKIERKHLSLRTWCSRLVRKGMRFSKDHRMHKIVVALVINFWFFQRII
jgi:insertion element IS1 protein InsB